MRQAFALLAILLAGSLAGVATAGDMRLLMLDQQGCAWCEMWDEEIGPVYDRTPEGRAAPLMRARLHGPLPEGVTLARRASFTPTFVLIEDGAEVGRIDGYPGADFFYPMLRRLILAAGGSLE